MISTTIDTLIIILLAGSIGYGYLISKKVTSLQNALRDLEPLVSAYSSAVDQSETSLRLMIDELNKEASAEQAQDKPKSEPTVGDHDRKRFSGVQTVTDKKELVRLFFDTPRTGRA